MRTLTHLQRLEGESIHVMREAVASSENPVMVYSIGKESSVLLRLAMKAFHPSRPPFPLLHVDTTWKFKEMVAFRDRTASELGLDLIVHVNKECVDQGISPFTHASAVHTDMWETQGLSQAIEQHGFDLAICDTCRDAEASHAPPSAFALHAASQGWDPELQRPEPWRLYNARRHPGASLRVFPLWNWTERDVWEYIGAGEVPIAPLYFARPRPVVARGGRLIMVDDDRMPLVPGERPAIRSVRFPAPGCYPLTPAVESAASDLESVLEETLGARPAGDRQLLRVILLGGAGAGKDTLLRRLLDHSRRLVGDGRLTSTTPSTGGPASWRITTARRELAITGTSGHECEIRGVLGAASTADVAVLVVDAADPTAAGTRIHSFLAGLFGITEVVVAVNKLDAAGWDRGAFESVAGECSAAVAVAGLEPTFIPVSALRGDNVIARSADTGWFDGPTLMEYLETVDVASELVARPFRMPVQWVHASDGGSRGCSGLVVSGAVHPGDAVTVLPSGEPSRVARIVTYDGDLAEAVPGDSVTLTLETAVDVARGDVLAAAAAAPEIADQFEADVVWLSGQPMLPGRSYLLMTGARTVSASVTDLKYRIDVDTMEHVPAKTLELEEVGVCALTVDQPVAFEPYAVSRDLGGFIMVDRFTNATVAAGMLHFALRRAHNIHWQAVQVDKESRAAINGHRPCVVWFTGLSGAGKSTIADRLEATLRSHGVHTYLLDGDNVRHGLNRDLGFTDADRVENIRRVAEVARLMVDAGLVVLASFISPFRAEREAARRLVGPDEFCEVFVDTPLSVAERHDRKGLYRKARAGQLRNFTGIDSPYEPPEDPEVRIDTTATSPEEAVAAIVDRLRSMRVLHS